MKRYVIAIYEGVLKIGQKVESESTFVYQIVDWYESQGYGTQVFEYDLK
jgi:hypothetical protein